LPALPDGGVRVLGDWNGDGVQTPGTFLDGRWQLWNQLQHPGRPPAVTATFGQAGDLPVTGDWNGDGVTDVGVVRGSQWLLALAPRSSDETPLTPWRSLALGDGTGVPVVGDWNGDGRDEIGTFRDGTWTLLDSWGKSSAAVTRSFGRAGDLPVVGDWDGDGRIGLGVERGSTWYLGDAVARPRRVVERSFAPLTGETPAVWTVAAATIRTCPTARPRRSGHAGWVVGSAMLDKNIRRRHLGRVGQRVRASLEQSERYLLGSQYHELWRATRADPYLDLLGQGRSDELSIRLPAMSALTVAAGLRTDAYEPAVVGRSRAAGFRYVDQLVRSIACAHAAVSPGGWGRGWQTAHWAMLAGAAAWLVWNKLTPTARADVSSMVVDEADRLSTQRVPYWKRPDGELVTPGDTKAEENAWNASLLDLAAAMMPRSPRATTWRAKAAELAVAAYSRRHDDTSPARVNGVPLSRRVQGFNTYPDGTVENHHIIHPDYAAAIELLWASADFDRLAGRRVAEAMFHNAGRVYSAFSTVTYQAGATSPAGGEYVDPGGTVYEIGHSWIYYPQGDDWGVARRAHFVDLDAHALVYRRYLHVPAARRAAMWPADRALAWHETGQMNLVAGSGATDGRTYSVDPTVAASQDTYAGREECAAQNLASAWLALYVGQIGIPGLDRGRLPVPQASTGAPKAPANSHLSP
jgi:hypothetical protein